MANTVRVALNRVYPASIYSRPAIAPMVVGVGGGVGKAQQQLSNMYQYTLQQMAVSPFSVNSDEYMKRIRDEYGYSDNGMYEAMGVVGGVVGSGVGALYGSGAVKEGIWKGFFTDNFILTDPSTWKGNIQQPFQKPKLQAPIYRDADGRWQAVGSKRQQTSAAFRTEQDGVKQFIKKNKELVDKYNKSLKGYNKAKADYNKLLKENKELKDLDTQYKKLKLYDSNSDEYKQVQAAITKIENDSPDLAKLYKDEQEKLTNTKTLHDTNTDAVKAEANKVVGKTRARITKEVTKDLVNATEDEITAEVSKRMSKELMATGAAKVGKEAGEGALKVGKTFMGYAGTAMDTASYAINIAGAVQAFKDEDWVNGILYALAAQGDEMAIAGDIVGSIPTPVTAIIGQIANIVGTAQSAIVGAILGYRLGETVGHSISPEGLKAQQLFAQNLYGSVINRPLTSVATVLTTVGVPALLNRMSAVQGNNFFSKSARAVGNFMSHNAWGNYVRSATTMMATQGINALTTKVEDTWNPPEEASDVNFVTAFSLVGDLNDNLFGATMNKATLLGLAKGDPKAQTDALAKAWGYSNEDIYYNPTFDDIREAAGIDLGNVGNSIISTIGEILIDPQNRAEIADKISTERTAKEGATAGARNLIVSKAKLISEQTPTVDSVHTRLLLHTTEDGYIIKKVKFNAETNKYEKINNTNASLPTVEICKDASDRYYNVSGEKAEDIDKTIIKDGISIDTDIEKAYKESDYESTYLNNLTSDVLEQELYNYYTNYLTNGSDGVRSYYIAQQTRFKKGSKYTAENTADRNFVKNMCDFIESTYVTTPSSRVNVTQLRNQLETEANNNPSEFKTKFNSLYKYYGVENATDLIAAMTQDFNLYISKNDIIKLYTEHEHFHNQMDMIDNAMKVINKIANPLLTLTGLTQKQLQDMITFSRNKTDPKHTAKMLVEIEEVLNGFTTADIEKAKKEIDEYSKKYVFNDEQFIGEVEQNETVKVHTALLDDTNKRYDKLIEELKQDIETINKQKSNRIYKDYTLINRANNNREVIHITKDNAKDIYNKIKELSQKESLNPLEKKTLREYTEAYTAYIQSDELDAIRIEYLKQVLHISETMNRMGTEASKVFMTIVQNFSKFTSYITKQGSDEKINDYLNMLNADFNIVIADEDVNIEAVDSKKMLRKVTPTRGKNLRLYYKVDFAEYICTLINNELSSLYGSNTTDVIGVNDVTTVRQLLGKHIDFSTWEDHKNKKETIRSIIGVLAKDSSSLRAGVLEDTCIDYILDMLRKHSGNKKEIIISKGLNNVDSNFLKRVIAHQLINNNDTFKNLFTTMQNNLDNLDKLLNVAGNAYKTESFSFKTVLQKHLQESLKLVLKQNPIFDLINDYAYSSGNYNSTTISLLPTYRSLFPILGKETTEKLIKGKLSYDECIKAHMTIASAEGVQKLEEVFQSTDYAKQYMSKQEPEATETSINVIPQDPNGTPQTSRMDSEEFLEFLKRNEEDIQTSLQEQELREAANKEAHLDKNKKSRIITSKYHINKRNKVTDAKYTVEEVLESLVTEGYNTMHISNDGYLEIVITPTHFIKDKMSKPFSYWIHNKDTSKVPGYKDEVEYFVDKLFREMQFSKGALKIRYKNATYTYDGNTLRKGNKEVNTLAQLKKNLVKSYMSYTDKGGIKLIYNKTETLKDSKFVLHRTATYYKRCVLAGLLKNLAIGLRNNTLKDIPEYNNHKPVYTNEKSYIVELKKYIKHLRNINSPLLDEYNKYAMSLYKEACAEAEKRLVNDEGIEINRTLNSLIRRLENFEESTIHGRSLNRPVVATDYVKRTISVDPYYRDIIKDFAHDTNETSFVKMLQLLDEYFVESATQSLPFKAKDYDSVRMIEDSETHQRTFMFKVKDSDEEVSLIELIMEYHITRPQLEALMSNTIPNAQNKDILHTYISDEYTKWCETFVKPVSEEDFINMIESKLDINDPNYDKKSAELKAEASKAYKILYENIDYRALITGLALNYRKTHKEELTPVKHFKERYNKETYKILEKVQNENEYKKYGCKNIYERYLVEVLKLKDKDLKKHLLNYVFFTDYKEAQSIFSKQHVKSLELQIDILKNAKNVDETWRKAQIDSLNTYKKYCDANHLYGNKNKETLISEILKVKTDDDIKKVLKVYNNVQKISNTKLYIPIKTNDEYKLVGVNTAKLFEQVKKGAGRLNPTIIGRFHDKFELNKGCKEINEFVYNDGYNHTLVVTDSIYDSNGNFIQNKYDKIKETYKSAKELYVLSKQQYLELQDMYDTGEIVSYTETELTFKDNVKDPEKIEVKFIDNRINVKAHRTATAFIEDLNNIKPYIKDDNFESLYEYVDTYNKYPMWLNSYIDNIQFTQTDKYKRLKHNMAVTEVFFEMTDAFKDMDINYDLLGEFFTNDYIKDGKAINKDSVSYRQLKDKKFVNGTTAADMLDFIIESLHSKYKDSDLTFNYSYVLDTTTVNTLFKLQNYMQVVLKQASLARHQGSLLMKFYKKFTNKDLQKLNADLIQEEQDYNANIWNELEGKTIEEKIKSLKDKYKKEHIDIDNEYIERLNKQNQDRNALKDHKLNFTTTHAIIKSIEELEKTNTPLFEFKDDEIIYKNKIIEQILGTSPEFVVLITELKNNYSENEVYNIVYNNIIRPFIQNIAVTFKSSKASTLDTDLQQMLVTDALLKSLGTSGFNDERLQLLQGDYKQAYYTIYKDNFKELNEYTQQLESNPHNIDITQSVSKYFELFKNWADTNNITINAVDLKSKIQLLLDTIKRASQCTQTKTDIEFLDGYYKPGINWDTYKRYFGTDFEVYKQEVIHEIFNNTVIGIQGILDPYVTEAIKNPNTIKHIDDFRKSVGMFNGEFKQKTTIVKSDYNYYKYNNKDLKRSSYIVFDEGYTRKDQKNIQTISERANNLYNIDLKTTDNLLHALARKFSSNLTINNTVISTDKQYKQFLKDNKITDKKSLHSYFYKESNYKNEITEDQYNELLEIYKLDLYYRRVMYNTNNTNQLNAIKTQYISKLKEVKSTLHITDNKQFFDLINGVFAESIKMFKYYKYIFHKEQPKVYTSERQMVTAINSNVFNISPRFKKQTKIDFEVFKFGNNTKTELQKMWKESKTLSVFYDKLIANKVIPNKQEVLYALLVTINHYKQIYFDNFRKAYSDMKTWTDAFYRLELGERSKQAKDLQALDFILGQGVDDGKHIQTDIHRPVKRLQKITRTVQSLNNDLAKVIADDEPSYVKNADAKYIVYKENEFTTTLRKIQNYTTRSIFANDDTIKGDLSIAQDINRITHSEQLDLAQELTAKNIDECSKIQPAFHEIRRKFTDIMEKILGTNFKEGQFVRVHNVAEAIKYLSEQPLLKGFYEKQFEYFLTTYGVNEKDVEDLIKAASKHFIDTSYLVNLNTGHIRGIIGYIYYTRYCKTPEKTRKKDIKQYVAQAAEQQVYYEQRTRQDDTTRIYKIANATNITEEQRVTQIANILYGTDNPSEEQLETVESIVYCYKEIAVSLLQARNLIDTHKLNIRENITDDEYEQRNLLEVQRIFTTNIEHIEKLIHKYSLSINTYKRVKRTLLFINNDNINKSTFNFTTLEEAKDVIKEIESSINDINNYIHKNKDNKEFYKALEHNRKLKDQIQGYIDVESDLKTKTEELQILKKQKLEEAEKFKELYKRLKNKKTNMKNFDLHKQFFNNTKSVEDVIKHAKEHGIIDNIEGDEALHNPEVDCIITAYNYLYMQGAIDENYNIDLDKVSDFIVLDMETARDLQNNPKPYQITFIKIHKEDTELKFDVNTIHLNHYAFFDGTVDNPGPCLKQFIEQQADMYKDENLTEAELKKRVQKIIDQVQYRKNSLPKYRMLLENLYRTSLPIVAHNGDRFDFKVLDEYMYKNSLHLLRDIYIDNITNIDFKKYRTELIENKITVDKYIEIITEPLKVLEEKYRRGEIFSSDVLESVKNLVQRALHEVAETAIKQDVITILKDRFTGNENPLYTGNKFDKLQQDFYTYYEDPSKLDSILVDYPEKEDQVRKLFEQIKEQLNTDIEHDTSVVTKATNEILEKLFKNKESITFNAEVYTKNIYEELKYYKDMLVKLQNNPEEATSIFNTHKQYVESIKNKINVNEQEIENLNTEIEKLEKDITTAEESMHSIYSNIYDAMTAIRNLKLQDIPRIRTALYRDFNEYRKHINLPIRTAQMFELNIAKAEKDIQAAYNLLISFAEAFKEHKTLMSEDIFDKGLININSAQAKDKLIKSYEERIAEIENRLNSIDTDWKQSITYVKELAESTIIPKYREDITNKINALDDGDIKDFMKKLEYDTCENINKSRELIMKRMSSDLEFSNLYHNTSKLNVIQQFETNTHYYKALELISQYKENIEIDQNLELTVKQILEQEKTMLENSIALASSSQLKNYGIAYSTVPQHIAQTLSRYVKATNDLNKIISQAISAASFHKTMGSICEYKDTDEKAYKQYLETFYKEASKHLTEEDDALLGTDYQRRYVDLKEGNDINGLTVNYNTAIYTYENNIIRISFNTEYYNELQTLIIPTDDNGKVKDIDTWKIEIRYTYNTDDRKFKNPKIYKHRYNVIDLINNKNKLWGNGGFISNDISTSYDYMLFQDDYDYNRDAIANVIEYAQNLSTKTNKLEAIKKNEVSKKFKTVYKYDVSLDDLVEINLTQRVNSEFEKRLALFNFAQETDFYLADTSQLYRDIYRRVMGNLNALKYGQYLMRLPEALGNDLIIKVTEDAIKNKSVELLKATDANMGWTFSIKDEYSIDPLFGANTNSVRSILTSNVLYATFTPIGVNNDLFFRQGNNKDTRLESYIYNLDNIEHKKTFETFANKQIDQELKHKKYNKKQQKEYRIQRMLEMKNNERMRYKILIEEMNGNDLDIFQLRVGQEDTLIKYEKDVLHPLGINISVAFTTDTRAFEDTILIDEDFALVMGWNEANKTWLKYGFKGAVKFVKGLKDMYGSYLVSKAPSVEDRGAYGVYLEMFCNKLLEYKKLGKHKELFDGTIFDKDLQVFDTHEAAKDCKDLIYVVGNKLVTKDAHIKDYAKLLDGLVQGTHKLDGTEIEDSISNGKQFIDFLKTKISKDSYIITNPVTGEKVEIKYDDKNNTVFAGTLYVLMDSEHTASHMQTEAKLMNADNELLGKFVRDIEGSVEKGGMWSFVVEQSAAQKVGYGWLDGLIGGDDVVTKDLANITMNIMLESGEAFSDIEDKISKELSLEERVQKVVSTIKYTYDLSDMYVSLLQEYYYSKYKKEIDPTSNVWIQRYAEASNKLKEHARDTYSGNKNIAYRTSYRRYWAARNQLLANTNLKTGEIKFPANAFNTLSKYGKDQWIKTNKVSIEDVNKLLEEYAEQYNKPEKYVIDVDNNGDIKVYIKVSDTESKLDDTNISHAEVYRRLRFLGFLDDNFKDIDKHKITREIQGAERTMSIDKLTLKDVNDLTQTIAYVAGIRSPVQDHNATPILKITGVVEHGAIEGNAAMYAIMGGDNDGDTAAFLAVKHEEVTNGVFKNLDASKQSYYDKDYLEALKGDLTPNADKLNTLNYYKQASTKYAYIGKNTSEFTTLEINNGIVTEGSAGRIRKGDAHYTYLEMLASADNTLVNKLIKIYKEEYKDKDIKIEELKGSEAKEIFWVESHVWIKGESVAEDLFTNKEAMTDYIKEYKDEINLYKHLEYFLNNTVKGKEFIQEHYIEMVEAAHFATLVRGHVSKVNVGITGGLRKDINLGTYLSIFPNMNKSIWSPKREDIVNQQNKLWNQEYGINDVEKLTINELAEKVLNKTKIFEWSLDELKNIRNIKELSTHSGSLDFDVISKTIIDFVTEYKLMERVLPKLIKFTTADEPTYSMLYDVLKEESEYLLEPALSIYKYAEAHKDEVVNDVIINVIKTYYCSRFVKEYNKRTSNVKTDEDIKQVTEQYLKEFKDQYLLTRVTSKELNDTIQKAISLSKHGSSLGDYTKVHEQLKANAEALKEKLAINKFACGNSDHHRRFIAMGFEYDIFERENIKFQVDEKIKEARKEATKENNKHLVLDRNNLKGSLTSAIKAIINNNMFNCYVEDIEDATKHYETFVKLISKSVLKNNKTIFNIHNLTADEIQQLKQAVAYFESYNVSMYKVIDATYNIIAKIRDAKQMGPVSVDSVYEHLVGILSFVGVNKERLLQTAGTNPDAVYIINFLTEKNNPITDTAKMLDDSIDDDTVQSLKPEIYSSMDEFEALANNVNVKEYGYPTADKITDEATKKYINDLNLIPLSHMVNGEGIIQGILEQIFRAYNVYTNQLTTRDNIKSSQDINYVQYNIIKDRVTDYEHIKKFTDNATKATRKLETKKTELQELQHKLNKTKAELQEKNIQLQRNNQTLIATETSTVEDTIIRTKQQVTELEEKHKQNILAKAKMAMLNNKESILEIITEPDSKSNIKLLDKDAVKNFENNLLVQMDSYQHPFSILVNAFRVYKDGKEDIEWNKMYKYLKDNYSSIRITEVMKAEDSEGLARKLIDYITVSDNEEYEIKRKGVIKKYKWEELTAKEQKKLLSKHNKNIRIESFEDLQELTKKTVGTTKYYLGKNTYDSLGNDINIKDFITPTLKQIHIKYPKDLKTLFEYIKNNNVAVGFTYLNDILSATEVAYKPYQMEGKFAHVAIAFNSFTKALMRMSAGFLVRNAVDTFEQLMSDMYQQQGLEYMMTNPHEIAKYILYGERIYDIYNMVSEERMLTLSNIMLAYKDIEKDINVEKNLNILYRYLSTYIKQGDALINPINRIEGRLKIAKQIEERYNDKKYNRKKVATQMATFLGNIKFREYYEFYDSKIINGKSVDGLRIDATASESRSSTRRLIKKINKQDDLANQLLFEISAFMETNAMPDMFRQHQYKELHVMVNTTKYNMTHVTQDQTIKEIEDEIKQIRKVAITDINGFIQTNVLKGFNVVVERTESLARILGFIYNRELYGKTFDDSVQNSLKMWFNYGQRSPLEMQLSFDIPYISFPLRSIQNWRTRLLDPRYARLMDDIIDGVYGQYADEDGQYSEYIQFMIQNGWLPITDKLGIRMGSGAFDIYNLMRDPAGQIEQRHSPILRGLQKLIETGDIAQSAKQLSTVGAISRFAQAATAGAVNISKGTVGKPSLGKASSMFFEYNQYTPNKYNYLYKNNGRVKWYENIYKDWFNKYGRMRKPTVDPVSLVNNIQWKQFLRRMQNKYRR